MLVDLMGMDKRPEEISVQSPAFRAVPTQSEQAVGAAADALDVRIEKISHVIQTAVSPKEVTLDCTRCRTEPLSAKFFRGRGITTSSQSSSSKSSGPAHPTYQTGIGRSTDTLCGSASTGFPTSPLKSASTLTRSPISAMSQAVMSPLESRR